CARSRIYYHYAMDYW
nr:immunoglobulin heavy chain junction region [Mus musculus]